MGPRGRHRGDHRRRHHHPARRRRLGRRRSGRGRPAHHLHPGQPADHPVPLPRPPARARRDARPPRPRARDRGRGRVPGPLGTVQAWLVEASAVGTVRIRGQDGRRRPARRPSSGPSGSTPRSASPRPPAGSPRPTGQHRGPPATGTSGADLVIADETVTTQPGTNGGPLVHHREHLMSATSTSTPRRGRGPPLGRGRAAVAGRPEQVLRRCGCPYLRTAAPEVRPPLRPTGTRPRSLRVLLDEEVRGRDEATKAMRRKAAGLPAGKTFGCPGEQDSSIPAPTQSAWPPWNGPPRRELAIRTIRHRARPTSWIPGAQGHRRGRWASWFTLESLTAAIGRAVDGTVSKRPGQGSPGPS